MKNILRVHALWLASALILLFGPMSAEAQKALVYCPAVDQSGCTTVKSALTSAFPGGVDTGDDGTNGTVDLRTADLFQYAVFFVPSLAQTDSAAPYARLREQAVVDRLKTALIGRRAFWSGTPDQGVLADTRPLKDQLIRNLAAWASGSFGTVNAPGLVVLQDNSEVVTQRYSWVQPIVGFQIIADPKLASYSAVTSLTSAGNAVLSANGSTLAYGNMASFGFQAPSGGAGLSMDAVGKTGTNIGGQVVLITQSGANTGGAVVTTDKDDYAPGTPVIITGSGFGANETVTLLFHEDPSLEADFTHTATTDANGAFTYSGFSPDTFDVDIRFILKATGGTSGRQAQTTFTDGKPNKVTVGTPTPTSATAGSSLTYPVTIEFNGTFNPGSPSCTATLSAAPVTPPNWVGVVAGTFSFPSTSVTSTGSDVNTTVTVNVPAGMAAGSYTFSVTATVTANCGQAGSATGTASLTVTSAVKQNQTITFVAIPNAVFGDSPTASASASSGLPVTLTSLTSPVCSITGVTITLNSTGTCTIHATQAGDATYNAATPVDRSFTVAQGSLSVTGITAANKVYDGNTTATLNTSAAALSPAASGVALDKTGAAGAFDTKLVGTNKTVTVSGLTLTGVNAGNYTLVQPTTTANITAKVLTATIVAVSKQYDGTTTAAVTPTLGAGVASGDVVAVSATNGAFDTKAVGNGKTVSATLALTGADANNYALTSTTATTTANITAKALTATITAPDKPYDGTTAATVTAAFVPGGVIGTDVVTLAASGAAFDTKAVGTGKTVTANLAISGADAGNYTVNPTATTTASITAKGLTATASAQNKVYDGTTTASATASLGSPSGVASGDAVDVSVSSATFDNRNVGTGKTVTVAVALTGADAANYSLASTSLTTTANITTRPIAVQADPKTKTYAQLDPELTYSVTSGTLAPGDAFSGALSRAPGENVGTYAIQQNTLIAGDNGNNNYALSFTGANLTITKADQLITFAKPADPTYGDAPVTVSGSASSSLVVTITASGACSISSGGGMNMLAPSAAGTCTVTASQPGDGNYNAAPDVVHTLTVAKKSLTVATLVASNKEYDGNATAQITSSTLGGIVGSDAVSLVVASATFDNKNVGNGKTVTAGSLSLTGAQAGNYMLGAATATTTANITAKAVTVSLTAQDKEYDGTTAATASGTANGTITGDAVTVSVTGAAFNNKNVGSGKPVSATVALVGADATNYSLASTTASTTAAITAKQLSVASVTVSDKIYDGNTSATITNRTLAAGAISGDDVSLTGGTATFSDKNVGASKSVSVSSLSLTGADAPNYTLAATIPPVTASITPKTITGSSITAANKEYDGTTAAQITPVLGAGKVTGDDVALAATGSFSDKNVGNGKTVTASLSLTGADGGNYTLNGVSTATTTANITAKALVGSFSASDKVYDGNTSANTTSPSLSGIITPDVVTLTVSGAAFADKNVGSGKTVTASLSIGGADAGNYSVNPTATATASITALAITGSITAQNKVYDGNATATIATRTLSGQISGDNVSYTGGTATFSDKNVANGKTVSATGLGLAGSDAGNYTVNGTASTTADITARTLTVTATAANKVYDGNAVAVATLADDRVSGDVFTASSTSAAFSDKNVGNGKTVTVSGISIAGTDAGNYTANTSTTTTANITALGITGSITASNKIYDGSASATIATRTLGGQITGDDVAYSGGTASFNNKNVGTGKAVSASGLGLTGADAGNYTVNGTASTTADITARTLVVSATGINKVYDNNQVGSVTLSDDRVSGDALTTAYGSATFASKDVGTGIVVSVAGITVTGTDAGNYAANTAASTTASITQRAITFDVTDQSIDWTGSTLTPTYAFTVTGGSYAPSEGPGSFTAASFSPVSVVNVGTYTVTLSGLANSNYNITRLDGTLTVLDKTKPTGSITELNPVAIGKIPVIKLNLTDVATGNSNIVSWQYKYDNGAYSSPIAVSPATPNANVTANLPSSSSTDVIQVCVKATDAGGNPSDEFCALLAVYDPTAGFVTGGGWIDSPAGAYFADKTLAGKANFGFVSKYQKGATVPTGNTEFQFKEGNLNFKSTNFQWLVIQGTTQSQFKGTGTINGAGNYQFLVTAIDGDAFTGTKKPDAFRIKITNGSDVVYDNKWMASDTDPDATILGGGSIQIQAK